MPEIKLLPKEATPRIFSYLEKKGLSRLIKPSKKASRYGDNDGDVED